VAITHDVGTRVNEARQGDGRAYLFSLPEVDSNKQIDAIRRRWRDDGPRAEGSASFKELTDAASASQGRGAARAVRARRALRKIRRAPPPMPPLPARHQSSARSTDHPRPARSRLGAAPPPRSRSRATSGTGMSPPAVCCSDPDVRCGGPPPCTQGQQRPPMGRRWRAARRPSSPWNPTTARGAAGRPRMLSEG